MEDKCSSSPVFKHTEPPFKYYEVHCYGDNDSECYLITTNESVARGFAMSQVSAVDSEHGLGSFRFHSIHFDEIDSHERLVL